MANVKFGIGLVGVVVVALANATTTWAQSDDSPRPPRERIGRALVDGGSPSAAAEFNREVKITASDGIVSDRFGQSVAVSGDTAIVGTWKDLATDLPGSVYVYRQGDGAVDNWGEVAKISSGYGVAVEHFGRSVAISGDTVIVGAPGSSSRVGAVHVYQRNEGGIGNWGRVTKIYANSPTHSAGFGEAVAISGDTAIVGYRKDDENGNDSGSAYVYRRNKGGPDNWGQVAKITASDGVAEDWFGYSVAISGDTAIVGTWRPFEEPKVPGSAYVYQRDEGGLDNWGEVTKITPSNGAAGDYFGRSVAISGDTAIVGAYGDDNESTASGSAFVFQRDEGGVDNWGEVAKITASDGAAYDFFGVSVGISGDTAIVGSAWDDDNGFGSGSAYVYQRHEGGVDSWGEVTKITASDGAFLDNFGSSVAVSGNTVIVGAPVSGGPDGTNIDFGSAYVYSTIRCLENAHCDDSDACTFDRCINTVCTYDVDVRYGDVGSVGNVCGPDGSVDLADILTVLEGFEGRFAAGCELVNIDIAGAQGSCQPNDQIDLDDILAVLAAFQGLDNCCANGP